MIPAEFKQIALLFSLLLAREDFGCYPTAPQSV